MPARPGAWSGIGVQRLHTIFEGLGVRLQDRHRSADLVSEITKQLTACRLHRFQPFSHLIERTAQSPKNLTQIWGRYADVIAPVGQCGRR